MHRTAPEVIHHFLEELPLVGQESVLEGHAAFKRPLGQGPFTKTVDGIDGRFVKLLESVVESLRRQVLVRVGADNCWQNASPICWPLKTW